jgi:hypothetical protein
MPPFLMGTAVFLGSEERTPGACSQLRGEDSNGIP